MHNKILSLQGIHKSLAKKKKYIEKVKSVYSGNKSNLNDTFKTSFYLQLESFYVNLINQGNLNLKESCLWFTGKA